jgi:hypothetical protein
MKTEISTPVPYKSEERIMLIFEVSLTVRKNLLAII